VGVPRGRHAVLGLLIIACLSVGTVSSGVAAAGHVPVVEAPELPIEDPIPIDTPANSSTGLSTGAQYRDDFVPEHTIVPNLESDVGSIPDSLPGTETVPAGPTELGSSEPAQVLGAALRAGGTVAVAAYLSEGIRPLDWTRWRSSFATFPLIARLRRDRLLEHPVRRLIYDTVRAHPGVHYRELLRLLGISNGTLAFHLTRLERAGFVRSLRVRGRKVFLSTDRESRPGDFLVSERQVRIVEFLRTRPGSSQREIMDSLALSRSSVSYNVRSLCALEIVVARRDDGVSRYYLR
jgi:DNA-binding MarR family transcriptional regulator